MMNFKEKLNMITVELMPEKELCASMGRTVEEHHTRMLEIVHQKLELAGIKRPTEKEH